MDLVLSHPLLLSSLLFPALPHSRRPAKKQNFASDRIRTCATFVITLLRSTTRTSVDDHQTDEEPIRVLRLNRSATLAESDQNLFFVSIYKISFQTPAGRVAGWLKGRPSRAPERV